MHKSIWYKIAFCLLLPVTLVAQNEFKYLNHSLPESWPESDSSFEQILPGEDQWWKNFNDPVLDSILSIAIRQNYSVLMAANRITMAKANLRMEQAAYSPTLAFSGGWLKQRSSGNTSANIPRTVTDYSNIALSSSWQVDLFGSIRNRVKAQKETFAASKAEYNATMITLCAEVANAYINLREMQQELKVANQNLNSQYAVVQITEKRFETGLASKLDVSQAYSVYYSTKATLPSIETAIIQYSNTLGVLMGLYPWDVRKITDKEQPLPNYVETVGVGIPSTLLIRRPDIRSDLHQINAQAAAVGASKSDWLPQIYLKGSIGFASHDFDKLVNHNSLTYEIAPTLTWNLFQGTKLLQATRLAKAQLDELINQYNNDVLTAIQEVDNAMNSYKNSIKEIIAMKQMVSQGKETLDLSLELYKQGLSPFQDVLDSQRSLLDYENQLTQAQGGSLLNLIQLYQALGGGWYETPSTESR